MCVFIFFLLILIFFADVHFFCLNFVNFGAVAGVGVGAIDVVRWLWFSFLDGILSVCVLVCMRVWVRCCCRFFLFIYSLHLKFCLFAMDRESAIKVSQIPFYEDQQQQQQQLQLQFQQNKNDPR